MVAKSDPNTGPSRQKAAATFELCICYAAGFGAETDNQEALRWLTVAARLNEATAQSLSYRMSSALGHAIDPPPQEVDRWLVSAASVGS